MPNTPYTLMLEQRRNSAEVQLFKIKVLSFLEKTKASEEVSYKLRCDLSKKIDMPFYGERKTKPICILSTKEIAKEYVRLLILNDDFDFSEELLTWLTKQQSQTLRKVHKLSKHQKARKSKFKNGVYEHPVPANYSKKFLLNCIAEKDLEKASCYIDYMSNNIPQIFLTKEEDYLVNQISRDDMPEGWDWKMDSPFARYIMANLPEDIYNK